VVALSATNAWAAGFSFIQSLGSSTTLIYHWDGTTWSVVTSPSPNTNNGLQAITAVPASSTLWAVGGTTPGNTGVEQTLTEQWNGISWSVVSSPNSGSQNNLLYGVAAFSTKDAWAVGSYTSGTIAQTLVEHWNGTSWSINSGPSLVPQFSSLYAVTVVPPLVPKSVWAVGRTTNSSNVPQTLTAHC
jgi:hypothetical protein